MVDSDDLRDERRPAAGRWALEAAIRQARARGERATAVVIDANEFWLVNRTVAAFEVERLMRELGSAIRVRLKEALVLRWDDTEYCCVLRGVGLGEAYRVIEAVRADYWKRTGRAISFGVAELGEGEGAPALLARAERVMQASRRRG